jgi:hypothetical protein
MIFGKIANSAHEMDDVLTRHECHPGGKDQCTRAHGFCKNSEQLWQNAKEVHCKTR